MRVLSQLSDVIKLPIPCSNPSCGKEFMETVRRMKAQRTATCSYCGTHVDLSSKEWCAYVDQFAQACDDLQVPYSRHGKSRR